VTDIKLDKENISLNRVWRYLRADLSMWVTFKLTDVVDPTAAQDCLQLKLMIDGAVVTINTLLMAQFNRGLQVIQATK